jgi:hypothetical protein
MRALGYVETKDGVTSSQGAQANEEGNVKTESARGTNIMFDTDKAEQND